MDGASCMGPNRQSIMKIDQNKRQKKQTKKKIIGPRGAPLQPGGTAADGGKWAVTSANDLHAVRL